MLPVKLQISLCRPVKFKGQGPQGSSLTPYYLFPAAHPIEPPTEVFYHLVKRTLTFRSPSTHYCVRIEVSPDGAGWNRYAECAPPSGSVKIRDGVPVTDVRIALCLQRRKEICSSTTKAFPGEFLILFYLDLFYSETLY